MGNVIGNRQTNGRTLVGWRRKPIGLLAKTYRLAERGTSPAQPHSFVSSCSPRFFVSIAAVSLLIGSVAKSFMPMYSYLEAVLLECLNEPWFTLLGLDCFMTDPHDVRCSGAEHVNGIQTGELQFICLKINAADMSISCCNVSINSIHHHLSLLNIFDLSLQ